MRSFFVQTDKEILMIFLINRPRKYFSKIYSSDIMLSI